MRMDMTSTKRTATTRKAWLGAAALAVVVTGMWSSMTPAMALAVVDQDDLNNGGQPFNAGDLYSSPIASSRPLAQTFTAGATGALKGVVVSLLKNGTGAGASASIYTTTGGVPDCVLATSAINAGDIGTYTFPTVTDNFSIEFSTPVQVQSGTQYAIVVSTTAGPANMLNWSGFQNGLYSGGTSLVRSAGTWGPITPGAPLVTADFGFQTYVDSSETGVSACGDSGGGSDAVDNTIWYQSYGRLTATEECASGYTGSWAQWANGNTGGYVCNRAVYSYRPEDETKNVFFGTWRTS
jgi:hypothetical protein